MHMHHTHGQSQADISNRRLVITILLNIGITVAEVIGGLLTGYLALLADAVHNLSDVAALLLAWLGARGARKPATKRSTYGYVRLEVMTAFISSVSLVVIALFILYEAYQRFIDPQPIIRPALFLAIATLGLIGNVVSMLMLKSEKGKSLNMKAAFLHMLYDAVSSVAVIIGGIVIMMTGWVQLDVLLSAAIALMIFWSSYLVIKEAVWIFMEAVPSDIDFDEVQMAMLEFLHISAVHDLHIWSLSSNEIALSCHVHIDELEFQRGPELVAEINRMLDDRFKIGHSTIQLEKEICQRPDPLCHRESEENSNL